MKSYVREFVGGIVSIYEPERRVDVVRNGVLCRFTVEDYEIMERIADHLGASKTTICEMLLEQAVYDAAEQLGLWRPNEQEEDTEEDQEE